MQPTPKAKTKPVVLDTLSLGAHVQEHRGTQKAQTPNIQLFNQGCCHESMHRIGQQDLKFLLAWETVFQKRYRHEGVHRFG